MIYPTITTTGEYLEKIKEIKLLKLEEICFFPTTLNRQKRGEVIKLLQKAGVKRIPLVHLRDDFESWEIDFLIKNFKTEVFNLHPLKYYPKINDFSKYKDRIFIENNPPLVLKEEEICQFAGVCLDFPHLEDDRLCDPKSYFHNLQIIKKYPCGCAHIGVIKKKAFYHPDKRKDGYDAHYLENLSELNYLKNYPKKYFPSIIAIELENSLEEQLKIKDYLINKLGISF